MKMKTTKTMMILIAILFSVSGSAWAMDFLPPAWRGGAFSTTQEWDFVTDGSGIGDYPLPDGTSGINNIPYGPSGLVVLANGGYFPGTGLDAGGAWLDPQLDMRIFNTGTSDPGTYKDVRIQVTYGTQPGTTILPPIIDIPWPGLASPINQQVFGVGPDSTGLEWFVVVEDWQIVPNPPEESITVTPALGPNTWISEVVVDTIHYEVPEPATICVLGFGALSLLRRKRKA